MTILLFLIPMSLVLLALAVWAFRWAVRKGQFENLDAAAIDILRDDRADLPPPVPDARTEADAAADAPGTGGPPATRAAGPDGEDVRTRRDGPGHAD